MAASIVGALEPQLQNLVKESKILLVGSGGIGCEVLKNLVLMGFSNLEIIDLDTIEVSNLNRQFLFQKDSVGKPKSQVARESVLKFNPNVNILSHVGDITDQKYGAAFFKKFILVINALDNRMARTHVNRMCLSHSIPLIESGTTGYSGQVEIIIKDKTMCYECLPKATPKVYPMCTIRNTPKEPIHCIVWAKFLFSELFGLPEEKVTFEMNPAETTSSSNEIIPLVSIREWADQTAYDKEKLLKKIFFDDILYMLYQMPDLYREKSIKPVPLDESLLKQRSDYKKASDTDILDLPQYITMFLDSIDSIKEKYKKNNDFLVWDKDDDDFMNFVVSSANIRSATFNIPLLNYFDIKSKAGNIIPAIATANAIIAGQIVIHALRILKGKIENCQSVFLRALPNHIGGMLVKDKKLQKPNPKCNVCSTKGRMVLLTDVNKVTIRQFEDLVLKQKLNIIAPDVLFDDRMIISSDEDDKLDMYNCIMSDLNIADRSIIVIDDYFQNYNVNMMLYHKERVNEEDPLFETFNSEEDYLKSKNENNGSIKKEEENNDCIIDDENDETKISNTLEVEQALNPTSKTESPVEEIDQKPSELEHEIQQNDIDKDKVPAIKRKIEDVDETEAKKVYVGDTTENKEEVLTPKRKADNEEVTESKKSRVDE